MNAPQIRDYLTNMIRVREAAGLNVRLRARNRKPFLYGSVEEFLLKFGRAWTPEAMPDDVKFGEVKSCFKNAHLLAIYAPDKTYVEGYAMGPIPVHHAWLVDREGRVIDPTWRELGTEYFGVPFTTKYVSRVAVKSRLYGVLFNTKAGWSYMTDPPETFLDPRWNPEKGVAL